MVKIAVVNSTSFGKKFPAHLKALERLGPVRVLKVPLSAGAPRLARALKGIHCVIAGVSPRFSREFFRLSAGALRLVSRHGIGYDNVDVKAAADYGVLVTKVPGPLEREAVSEHALALLLACLRGIPQAREAASKGQWARRMEFTGGEIRGKTAGILGIGNIGSRTAEILKKGFGARVLAYDPYLKPGLIRKRGGEPVSFRQVLSRPDFVFLHCSLNRKNLHFINRQAFSLMKKGTILVNTARGELVEMKSLLSNLKNRKIAAFGADVVEGEPLENPGHPLLKLNNAVIVPHIAAYTLEAMEAMGLKCVRDVRDVASGRIPKRS